jgi:hypothetical protein
MSETDSGPLSEDWDLLLSFFPFGWQEQAILSGALERLRGFGSVGDLLRVLLLHVGKGYSLRETAVRAREAGLAEVSDVALLKRLRNAEPWWRGLCVALLRESGFHMACDSRGWNVRVVDGTLIKEPGQGGQQWRIHYSLQLPDLECDQFLLTAVKGKGTGEALQRFAAAPRDLLLADRGYCRPVGVKKLSQQGAAVVVRLNSSMPLCQSNGKPFPLLQRVQSLQKPGHPREWKVGMLAEGELVMGRLCAIRKSRDSADRERRKILRKAQQGGPKPKPATLEYANYVLAFTTLPAAEFSTAEVLRWYRLRWQIELVFKRMKSLAQLGHLPKHDDRSSRAWLYGKLLIALLGQKLMRVGRDISPWGYSEPEFPTAQPLA